MTRWRWLPPVLIAALVFAHPGCEKRKPPAREHFPMIKEQVNRLQAAVRLRDRAAIDSILTPSMRGREDGADALLTFVYGPDGDLAFDVFGEYDIVYTHKRARVDCFIMDSTAARGRPVTFTFELKDDQWLLKRFEVTEEPMWEPDDSVATE